MSRTTTPLTDTACRFAKPTDRPYKLFDGDGRKGWRLRYVKPDGREGLTSLGNYPVIGLGDARQKRLEAKQMLADGIDPVESRRKAKQGDMVSGATFESVALGWHKNKSIKCSGLLTPDTFLGENDRHTEVFDEQTTTYLHPRLQA